MRRAIWQVTPEFLIETAKRQGFIRRVRVVGNPLPDDATLVAVHYDPTWNRVNLIVESDAFQDVPVGQRLPELPSTHFETVFDDQEKLGG